MKTKNLLILFILLSCIILKGIAQPILTAAGINPVIGDQFKMVIAFTTVPGPGNAGANQTWDLSSMSHDDTLSFAGDAVSSTPYASNYPSANIVYDITGNYSGSSNTYYYYNISSSNWTSYGWETSTCKTLFSDPEDGMHYPFTYNSSFTDAWNYTATGSGCNGSGSQGSVTFTADGYGTLKTPAGTFKNVLRVSDYQNGTLFAYYWYLNGNHYNIATIVPGAEGWYRMNVNTGIDEQESLVSSYQLFPNPASDYLNLNFKMLKAAKGVIKLYDVLGKEVSNSVYFDGVQGDNPYKINITSLQNGIYLAEIIINGVPSSQRRFVVQR